MTKKVEILETETLSGEGFEKELNELQDKYEGVAALYAANCLLENGEVVPLIKIKYFKQNVDKSKK